MTEKPLDMLASDAAAALASSGAKVALAVAGAALSVPHLLWRQPGFSRYFLAGDLLYDDAEVRAYAGLESTAVCADTARALAEACHRRHPQATLALAVTAAVTTATRARQGENRAHLALSVRSMPAGRPVILTRELGPEALPKALERDACEAVVAKAALGLLLEGLKLHRADAGGAATA